MSNLTNALRAGVAAFIIALPVAAQAEDASVVLVHGAFSDGSAWNKVIPILQDAGVSVGAAQLHLASREGDAATFRTARSYSSVIPMAAALSHRLVHMMM